MSCKNWELYFYVYLLQKSVSAFNPWLSPKKVLIKNIFHATKLYSLFYFLIHVHRKMGRNSFTTRMQLKKATTLWINGSFPSHNHWFSSSGLRWPVRTFYQFFSIKLALWSVCMLNLFRHKIIHVCWMLSGIDQLFVQVFFGGEERKLSLL